jgi:hypothetical protein
VAKRVLPEPLTAPRLPKSPAGAVELQRESLAQVQALARRVAQGHADPGTLGTLVQEASHVIGLQRRADYLERKTLGLPEPHPAPKGVSEIAWRAAWLQRAEVAGLSSQAAAAHLANAFPSPMLSGVTAMRVPIAKLALEAARTARASVDLERQLGMRQ